MTPKNARPSLPSRRAAAVVDEGLPGLFGGAGGVLGGAAHVPEAAFEVIGPVLLITAVGYALGRSRLVAAQPLTALSALVLIPALVFYALTTSTLPRAAFARIGGFIVVQFLLVAFVVWIFARMHRWDRVRTAGVLLATQISNAGNAGLPLVFFAWGQTGLTAAVGFFAVQAVLVNLLAVYIGAGATSSGAHPGRAATDPERRRRTSASSPGGSPLRR